MTYHDRTAAGQYLGKILVEYNLENPIVFAIPNGGVVVGKEIAKSLKCSLRLVVVKKIPIPENPEAGFGAVTSDGTVILNQPLVRQLNLSPKQIETLAKKVYQKIKERITYYGVTDNYQDIKDKTIILVDDGIASGITMEAALKTIKNYQPAYILIATPTAFYRAFQKLIYYVDAIICPDIRYGAFFAVADAYEVWYDLSDEEVKNLLEKP